MSATIKDVAREAQVSIATVSRVFNESGSVSEETRRRVRAVAERLRYVPHHGARSLITRRTNLLGVVLPEVYGEFFSELIRGIDLSGRAYGVHILVSGSHGGSDEAAAAIRAMQGRVDGLLAMLPNVDPDFLATRLPDSMPVVLMNTPQRESRAASVVVDNFGGAGALVRHLVDCGYRRIAFISGPESNFDARERLRGFRTALAALGPEATCEVVGGDFTEESGYQAGKRIAAMPTRPDAVFAANDSMAIGCLFALREAGLNVPADIGLTGFDDIPIARFMNPPLTTVRVRIAELGELALERLVHAIRHPDQRAEPAHVVPCDLVVRGSCRSSTAAADAAEGGRRQE